MVDRPNAVSFLLSPDNGLLSAVSLSCLLSSESCFLNSGFWILNSSFVWFVVHFRLCSLRPHFSTLTDTMRVPGISPSRIGRALSGSSTSPTRV